MTTAVKVRCQGCGSPFDRPSHRGREPKWCSETCRKAQYDKTCIDCGARISGTDPGKASGRCVVCSSRLTGAACTVWTREAIITAIQAWAAEYGEPPATADWFPPKARAINDPARAERFELAAGRWPWKSAVERQFGSWNAAIAAAGFEPRARHGGDGNELRQRRFRKATAFNGPAPAEALSEARA